jgi:hypothetical protein
MDGPVESNSGTAVMPAMGLEDVQASIRKVIKSLEVISRRLCEGNPVDSNHADVVIGMLKHILDVAQHARVWGSPVLPLKTHGLNEVSSETLIRMGPGSFGKKCLNQMRESLGMIKVNSEDMHHKIDFVNAAIDCMNLLRRQGFAECQF